MCSRTAAGKKGVWRRQRWESAAETLKADELIQGRCNRWEEKRAKDKLGNTMRKGTSKVYSERLARDRKRVDTKSQGRESLIGLNIFNQWFQTRSLWTVGRQTCKQVKCWAIHYRAMSNGLWKDRRSNSGCKHHRSDTWAGPWRMTGVWHGKLCVCMYTFGLRESEWERDEWGQTHIWRDLAFQKELDPRGRPHHP